jgi:hypothetical protein
VIHVFFSIGSMRGVIVTIILNVLVLSSLPIFLHQIALASSSSTVSLSPSLLLHRTKQQHFIELCCAWGDKLATGILKYEIVGGNSVARQAINQAIGEWNSKINGIKLVEKSVHNSDISPADIEIRFNSYAQKVIGNIGHSGARSGGHMIAGDKTIRMVRPGESTINFDTRGFIDQVSITISTSALGSSFDTAKLEQIAKHEIGHAFGIGHTNFVSDLMSPILGAKTKTSISSCDVNAFLEANQWKVARSNNSDNTPSPPPVSSLRC